MKQIHNEIELNDLMKQDYLVILVKTHTCTVCHAIEPKIDNLHKELNFENGYYLYAEEFEQFIGQNLIFSSPTLLVYYEGKEVYRSARFIQMDAYARFLDKLL